MGKVESILRAEISRLAQREVRGRLRPFQRELKEVKNQLSRLGKDLAAARPAPALKGPNERGKVKLEAGDGRKTSRFSPQRIRALREKLGLSQRELALLAGVSTGAVGLWEKGKFAPTGAKKAALAALGKTGKREIKKLLAEKNASSEKIPEGGPGQLAEGKKRPRRGKISRAPRPRRKRAPAKVEIAAPAE